MAEPNLPEQGTLIIAALLVLALIFSATWIVQWAAPGGNPQAIIPWFLAAAGAIVLLGGIVFLVARRRG